MGVLQRSCNIERGGKSVLLPISNNNFVLSQITLYLSRVVNIWEHFIFIFFLKKQI